MMLIDQDIAPGLKSAYNQGFAAWLAEFLLFSWILNLYYFHG